MVRRGMVQGWGCFSSKPRILVSRSLHEFEFSLSRRCGRICKFPDESRKFVEGSCSALSTSVGRCIVLQIPVFSPNLVEARIEIG